MVKAENLSKQFGNTHAVIDVTFALQAGAITGLLGHNGAGKTTTIRMLLDLLLPDSGTITCAFDRRTEVGYVPEEKGLYKNATAGENIRYLASLRGITAEMAERETKNYLDFFGLADFTAKKVVQLSKGYQQLTQIFVACIANPRFIVMDEPFNGLDPSMQDRFAAFLQHLKEQGKCILVSTHLLEKAGELCDNVLLLHKGKLVFAGELAALNNQIKPVELRLKQGNGEIITEFFADFKSLNEYLEKNNGVQVAGIKLNNSTLKETFLGMLKKGEA